MSRPDIENAMAVDLTTKHQTTIVEVLATAEAANTFENPADLDQGN